MEGFDILDITLLDVTTSEGLINGRAVASTVHGVTAAASTFEGFLISEDGDGTFTITQTADAASAVLAAAAALALDVPAGGIAVLTGAVSPTVVTLPSMEQRGKLPKVSVLG